MAGFSHYYREELAIEAIDEICGDIDTEGKIVDVDSSGDSESEVTP